VCRHRLIDIENPGARTARDEQGQTRLGEVDRFVGVHEFDSVWRAPAVREQGPRLGKGLGAVSERAG